MSNQDKGLITGIFSAINSDPELGRLVREQVFAAKKEAGQAWATHAIARGEISADADTDLANELAISTLFHRVVITGDPVDERSSLASSTPSSSHPHPLGKKSPLLGKDTA